MGRDKENRYTTLMATNLLDSSKACTKLLEECGFQNVQSKKAQWGKSSWTVPMDPPPVAADTLCTTNLIL